MSTIVVDTDNQNLEKVLMYLKELNIKFELIPDNNPYNSEFVKKMEKSRADLKNGKAKSITLEDLDKLWK
jgi:hypothetical protein